MSENAENIAVTPARAPNLTPGNNGNIPPVHSRFGQPGANPGSMIAKKYGATSEQWYNVMGEWGLDRVEAVLTDRKAPICQINAAQQLLAAAAGNLTAQKEMCDRTAGSSVGRSEDVTDRRYVKVVNLHDGKPAKPDN